MFSIFYDLETSDKNTIGQILNYSFICVDEDFNIVDELSGLIRLSRLQLPSPSAILANKVNVMQHQVEATDDEKAAMFKIAAFIEQCIVSANEKICFIGFNSARFDLPYLRTSLIRNGINPYFMGKLVYRDLLLLAKKLSCCHNDFPRGAKFNSGSIEETQRLSLSLETLCNRLGLLSGKQTHESRDDVLITIELAKCFKEKYLLDYRSYEPYEGGALHKSVRSGLVVFCSQPQYDLSISNIKSVSPITLLDADHRYALWIDLKRYQDGLGRKSIQWINQNGGCLFIDETVVPEREQKEVAVAALNEFQKINLKNFFQTSTCDIEQDIYRLDMSAIEMLRQAIWLGKRDSLGKNPIKDAKIIMLRHEINQHKWGSSNDAKVEDLLKMYGLHRYGGKLQIEKIVNNECEFAGENAFHPTLAQYLHEISEKIPTCSVQDKELLQSLREYYLNSDIYRLCGQQIAANCVQ